jgi:hypothetical protein
MTSKQLRVALEELEWELAFTAYPSRNLMKAVTAIRQALAEHRQWTDTDIDKLSVLAGFDPAHKVELGLVRSVVRTILREETK